MHLPPADADTTKQIQKYLVPSQLIIMFYAVCSGHFWAGLSAYLVIEHSLMRSVKSLGGLTHDRGMGDSQRTQWLLSGSASAVMNSVTQSVTGSESATSCQQAVSIRK
ncbi:hypothetical protein PoB_005261100 [Plakobranchus ocellatus]|uniref:Uncharacterized protein n=1 Tax=Plakobranchus ocellatus TaxID=259542 RepID=A0AAV4C007_9GAST|nr:hypothetical protein PoB_005261100 [Plakobranchus ocellatus]